MHRCGNLPQLGGLPCVEAACDIPSARGPPLEQKVQHARADPGDVQAQLGFVPCAPSAWREARAERGDVQPQLGLVHGTPSAWREAEFGSWMEQRLAAERAALLKELRLCVDRQLAEHHRSLLEEAEAHLSLGISAAGPLLLSDFRDLGARRGSSRRGSTRSQSPKNPAEVAEEPARRAASTENEQAAHQSRGIKPRYKTRRLHDLATGATQDGLSSLVERVVGSTAFEVLAIVLILVNILVMAVEVQYTGREVCYDMKHPDCRIPAEDAWPGASATFSILPIIFSVVFLIEFLLRFGAIGRGAFCSAWMWFDFVLLALGWMDAVQRLGSESYSTLNPAMMRVARTARLLRLLKVIRSKDGFSSLFLLVKSLEASGLALFWSVALIFLVMTCIGMMMNQLIYSYLADSSLAGEDRIEVYNYYGTFTRIIVTMFELTLGNWAPPSRLLMSKVGEWWGMFIVVYRCVVCFAIVNVTAAVFITETTRVAAGDDEVLLMRKERANRANSQRLKDMFMELDSSGDGLLCLEEFQSLLTDEVLRQFLATVDIEITELEELFRLLDDGDGKVDIHEFTHGMNMLRGQAKSVDLLTVLKLVRAMDRKIDRSTRAMRPFL